MKVSCESVLIEGVGRGDDSKMPSGIFTTSVARGNDTRRARFFLPLLIFARVT